ncbi:MAG: oligosaccharide flippase family protein [Deltaproteobacteria bacterium]|nr:oligosaccharide flippase family protein [Deltaproteobacteria bacterium]MCW5807121.1 oligosaccharide flippase family protein [Deltaproteobacteria bacterium]
MSLAKKAARGALWTIASSMGGRFIGVIGTLVMTRFLAPEQIGEVSDATIIAMTGNWATIWGFGQYSVVKGRGEDARSVRWHATVAYMGLGAIGLGLVALFGGQLAPFFDAPRAASYVPGMALALYIRRLGAMPERVLAQQMNFRASGIAMVVGELSYTVSALGLAALGHGGWSIVFANLIQSTVVVLILLRAAGIASWATPAPLRWERYKDMLKFGVPLGIQGLAHGAARYWGTLAVSHYFGPGPTGAYNMAYNLADIPAIQVGEQIALVLMPSMAELPPERRPRALERSTALLSLIIFPLAVGLGLVAYPLVALILPNNEWQLVAPLLVVLTCLSVFRPITWVLSAYFEAESKTNRLMILEIAKLAILLACIALLAPSGVRAASGAVGIAFGVTAVAGIVMVSREGPSWRRLVMGFVQPALACVVMAAVDVALYEAMEHAGVTRPAVQLVALIVVGAAAYIAAALVICRETSRDLLDLLKKALRRD